MKGKETPCQTEVRDTSKWPLPANGTNHEQDSSLGGFCRHEPISPIQSHGEDEVEAIEDELEKDP